ncbi:MAG TPA: hypothetical protein VHE36_03145 [Sphingomicrobium sp.]|nr:hypothetical protein [Sphingomicrobium sp.]
MSDDEIEEQIERCRRIASVMTDEDIRNSLERLAREYEAQLPPGRRHFLLSDGPQGLEPAPSPAAAVHRE